jgi:hypothetical protein
MTRAKSSLTLKLPAEFIELCRRDQVEPEAVLRGFIADLCEIVSWHSNPRTDGYCSNGSDERRYAMEYYERVGWPWINKPPEG